MVASNPGRQAARDPEGRCDLPCGLRSARETHGTLYISSPCRGIRRDYREAQPRPLMQAAQISLASGLLAVESAEICACCLSIGGCAPAVPVDWPIRKPQIFNKTST